MISPHAETAAKTTATTAILSTSCKGGERPGKHKPEELGVRPSLGPARVALVGHGASLSPGHSQFICHLVSNQRFVLQAVVHGMSNLGQVLPTGFLGHPPSPPMFCSPSPWPGAINLGPSLRGSSQSPAIRPAKDCALVGSETGNCC